MKQILRQEWGFQGFVVTDWGGGNDFTKGTETAPIFRCRAADLTAQDNFWQRIKDGKITEKEVDERVDELLQAALSYPNSPEKRKKELEKQKEELHRSHHRLAQKAAEESMVLLKMKQRYFH